MATLVNRNVNYTFHITFHHRELTTIKYFLNVSTFSFIFVFFNTTFFSIIISKHHWFHCIWCKCFIYYVMTIKGCLTIMLILGIKEKGKTSIIIIIKHSTLIIQFFLFHYNYKKRQWIYFYFNDLIYFNVLLRVFSYYLPEGHSV